MLRDLEGKHIAIDGKRLKGSKKKTGSTHILSACMRTYKTASQVNTRLIAMRPWRKIMVVLRSEPIPHYRLQRFLTRGNIVNGKA